MPGESDPLVQLVATAQTLFPDFEFISPGGVLRLSEPLGPVERLRIELPSKEPLHLQSIGITADGVGVDDVAALATVTTSSWFGDYERRFDAKRLFDFANPTGAVLHTLGGDQPPWAEVAFGRALEVRAIELRNVPSHRNSRAHGIRVLVAAPGEELRVVYDAAQRLAELTALLERTLALQPQEPDVDTRALVPVLAKTLAAEYNAARVEFDGLEDLSDDRRRAFRALVSDLVLKDRSLQWTIHGPQRCFRFWGTKEKQDYIQYAAQVAQDLSTLTEKVCFGFGAALAVVRDGDLIPHDDDLDLIIGFDPEQAADLPSAHRLVEEHLRAQGYTVTGNFTAHRHVAKPGVKKLDVFVGLFEGDIIAWYPGKRGTLNRDMMFPTSQGSMLDVVVPLPRSPLLYLEQVYGPGWRKPDPGFKHSWDRSAYADLVKRPGSAAPSASPSPAPASAAAPAPTPSPDAPPVADAVPADEDAGKKRRWLRG